MVLKPTEEMVSLYSPAGTLMVYSPEALLLVPFTSLPLRRITSAPRTAFPSAVIFPLKVACCATANIGKRKNIIR